MSDDSELTSFTRERIAADGLATILEKIVSARALIGYRLSSRQARMADGEREELERDFLRLVSIEQELVAMRHRFDHRYRSS